MDPRDKDWFEIGPHNAADFVLSFGGTPETAEKFQTYCQIYDNVMPPMAVDPAPPNGSTWGTHVQDQIEFLFEICDIQFEEIVEQIGRILA